MTFCRLELVSVATNLIAVQKSQSTLVYMIKLRCGSDWVVRAVTVDEKRERTMTHFTSSSHLCRQQVHDGKLDVMAATFLIVFVFLYSNPSLEVDALGEPASQPLMHTLFIAQESTNGKLVSKT